MSRVARFALRHPAATVGLLLLASLAAVLGLPRLRSDVGYRAFLGANHPSIRRFDAFLARFGGGLPMLAVWSCPESPCKSALDPAALEMAAKVEQALARNPYVHGVTSPASAPLLVPAAFFPSKRHLVEKGRVAPDREALARRALADPEWVGRLISKDGRVGAIIVDVSSSESDAARSVYASLDGALAPFEAHGWTFYRAGGPVEFVVAGGELQRATARLVPVMVLLVGGTLLVLFRSAIAAAAALATVGVAVLWTMGLHGWLGWPQNSISQTLAPLVLVIGVCDAIHMVARYANDATPGRATSRAERRALLETIAADVGGACTMTSLTTAAGFASFVLSPLESFARFGLVASFGIMAALLLTFALLPLLLLFVAPERLHTRSLSQRWDAALARLMDFDLRHTTAILVAALVLGAASTLGMARLRVDASFEELYGEHSRVVQWSNFIASRLARPDRLELDLTLPPGAAPADPATLRVVRRVSDSLSAIHAFGAARSLLDPLTELQRAVGLTTPPPGSDGASPEATAGLYRALERAPGRAGLARWVGAQGRHLRISVEAEKSPQDVMRRVLAQVQEDLDRDLPPGWSASLTGPYAVVHDMVEAIRATQLASFAGAGVMVALMLAVFLRSVRWALLALLPTALPVVATLGIMGLAGIPLDVGSAMVAAVVLGIAVDDAIHMLDRMRRLRQAGRPHAQAVHDAVLHVGRALASTSFALAIGFAALALSPWQSIASFGLLSAVAILGALLADLLVLPALFLRLAGDRPRGSAPQIR